MRSETVDLEDGIAETEENIAELEEQRDELVERLKEEYGDFADVPQKLAQKYEQYEEGRKNLIGRVNAIVADVLLFGGMTEDDIDDLRSEYEGGLRGYYREEGPNVGPSEFSITEITGGQLAEVQDTVNARASSEALASGDAQDMNGTRVVATLRAAVEQSPAGAPEDPADYRWQVMLYLFEQVNSLNTVGDTDFRTTSLQQAMDDGS